MIPVIRFNSALAVLLVIFFFFYPVGRAIWDLRDPALQKPGVPKFAWRLFRNLTPRYATWAGNRVAEGRAEALSTADISGTEWPLFGSVFYLWAVENLQAAWDAGDHTPAVEPRVSARSGIVAASELVIDPKHAAWVKKHWGPDYLHRENVFYRMLVMAALTSRANLLKDNAHLDLLRDQVESFARELDASKSGLLDDYPGECYPGDVMAALLCLRRADAVLGTDHSELIRRALRGFTGTAATRHQLPPYAANAQTGLPISDARGCANSYMALTAPELWPAQARQWFELYDRFFWQERFTAAGYREYPKTAPRSDWTMDVDAGPVVAGHGVSASAFGVGAARKNGRFDRAYPLATEMLATVGELPTGVLLVPRLLSNLSDAPMLGEAAILWQLTIQPEKGFPVKSGGTVPTYVYVVLSAAFFFGLWRMIVSIRNFREPKRLLEAGIPGARLQLVVWAISLLFGVVAVAMGHGIAGTLALALAVLLPVRKCKKKRDEFEDWPEARARAKQAKEANG